MCLLVRVDGCNILVTNDAGDTTSYTGIEQLTSSYAVLTPGSVRITAEEVLNSGDLTEYFADFMKDCQGACCEVTDGGGPVDPPVVTPPETLKSCNIELKDGETICLKQIIQDKGAKGVASFDFDLKPCNGETFNGFIATASQATSTGTIGTRDLDGGGSFSVSCVQYINGTFREVGAQCFQVAQGSVAELIVELIY